MKQVTIDGAEYSIDKLDAMSQFHLSRRLSPILAAFLKAKKKPTNGASTKRDVNEAIANEELIATMGELLSDLAGPVTEALAAMPDEQAEKIIWPCMSVVKRAQGAGAFAPIKTPGANRFMFPIDGLTMVRLTIEVIKENLSGYFASAQAAISTAPTP
jgi:hypothetical protein